MITKQTIYIFKEDIEKLYKQTQGNIEFSSGMFKLDQDTKINNTWRINFEEIKIEIKEE